MLLYAIFTLILLVRVQGHGRLRDPPSRSSMWRDGFDNPKNYNDNELFCGGFHHQYSAGIGGRCGVCGDAWDASDPENEAGGKYANGIITRTYQQGQTVQMKVEINAHHKGWFEFRICPNIDVTRKVTHDCLNKHVLQLADGSGTRYPLTLIQLHYYINVDLPANVTCDQCVVQWKYHAGNSWGRDPDGTACIGCGDQEEFYGCADVRIQPNDGNVHYEASTTTAAASNGPQTTTAGASHREEHEYDHSEWPIVMTKRVCTPSTLWSQYSWMTDWCKNHCLDERCSDVYCKCSIVTCTRFVATGYHKDDAVMDDFCDVKCRLSKCPEDLCRCDTTPIKRCKATDAYAEIADFHQYCQNACSTGYCSYEHCECISW